MSKYHNDKVAATHPGRLSFSTQKFRQLEPQARGLRGWWWRLRYFGLSYEKIFAEHLQIGDSRAAVVISIDPLLVAAYTDELDCVVILKFAAWLVAEYRLKPGTMLLTVNTYWNSGKVAPDLKPGPHDLGNYTNYFPIIAEFVSDDDRRIETRKAQIDAAEWRRCADFGRAALRKHPNRCRNGSPLFSQNPSP